MRTLRFVIALAALGALLVPTLAVGAKPGEELNLARCAPDQNTFSSTVDNSYFPLPVGQQWVYQGNEQGQTIGLQITVLKKTEKLYSGTVSTRVVEEAEWEDTNGNGLIARKKT